MNYNEFIDNFYSKLKGIDSEITDIKLSEDKWSLKEIVGHLIDSASNNHQRFVRLQFGDLLDFPQYEGEEWVKIQNYNVMSWEMLVSLWYNYNSLIINLVSNIDEANYNNIWVKDSDDTITLQELIEHYFKHLQIHIDHFNNRMKELSV